MNLPESAVRFGRSNNLIGVLTEPAESPPVQQPAVLLLSPGVVHSAGPFRMYVELARALAGLGFTVLRFDMAGIGDSVQPRDARTVKERTIEDVTDAMDFLTRRLNVRSFVLGGLCSAADDAHALANVDDRVVANIMLDGFAFPTWRFHVRRVTSKFAAPSVIARASARLSREIKSRLEASSEDSLPPHVPRPFPNGKTFRSEVRESLKRGVQYLCIFSGGVDYYNYEGQFRRFMGISSSDSGLTEVYIHEAEHTYPISAHRSRMVEVVSQWTSARFGKGYPKPCSIGT